jgi:peptide-methionine (R)-S-oxide reductase
MKSLVALVATMVALSSCAYQSNQTPQKENSDLPAPRTDSPKRKDKVIKTDAEWKRILTEEQYKILRHGSTEAPFCTPWHGTKRTGTYFCGGCKLPLFNSSAKFESGTGWPSFMRPAARDAVWTKVDNSMGMVRLEVLCARCDGHLGHVFDDGPKPTNLRYCINSKSMLFQEKGSKKFEIPD